MVANVQQLLLLPRLLRERKNQQSWSVSVGLEAAWKPRVHPQGRRSSDHLSPAAPNARREPAGQGKSEAVLLRDGVMVSSNNREERVPSLDEPSTRRKIRCTRPPLKPVPASLSYTGQLSPRLPAMVHLSLSLSHFVSTARARCLQHNPVVLCQ